VGPGVAVALHNQLPATVGNHRNKRRDDRSKSMGPGGLLPGMLAAASSIRTAPTTAPCSPEVSSLLRFLQGKNHMSIMYVLLSRDVDASKLMQDQLILAKQMPTGGDTESVTHDFVLDKEGRTALHVAAAYGCEYKIIQTLLEDGDGRIQAVVRDNRNRTPLHWACCKYCLSSSISSRNLDVVKALVSANPAAVKIRDEDGYTPLDIAKITSHHNTPSQELQQLVELLEEVIDDDHLISEGMGRGMDRSAEVTAISCNSCDDDDLSSLEWEGDGQNSYLFDTERLKL
jgi:Ankyrin repeats (3 copies)